MKFVHTHTFGDRGEAKDQFRVRITGLAVAADGRLFAGGERQIKTFSPEGKLLEQFDTVDRVWSIAVEGDLLWIGMRGRIEQFDYSGNSRSVIDDPQRLGRLTGIAAGRGHLLVGDASHKCLWLYESGRLQGRVGDDVNTRGFMIPNGVLSVAFDPIRHSFVVSHPQKHRIERYNLDGALIGKFGRFGHEEPGAFGGCCNPTTCTVTPKGMILVSEKAPPRVKAFTADGKFLAMIDEGAFDASSKNQFLAADKSGRVYATDSVRGTIEVFQLVDEQRERKE